MLTFHGSDMNVWPDEKPERLPDLRAAVRDAGAVIAVSRALAERVRSVVGVDAVALPIGCDHRSLGASTVPRELAREALGVAEDVIVVLFVGRLERAKGIRELATAILRLGDPFRAVFVGDGPEAGFGADDADARRRLVYVGTRPNEDVVRFLSAADVFVLPSYREGLPTVLVEAGSVGVPVIATAVGGVPELLGPDRGALLPEATADAVISALTRFRGDRAGAAAAATRLRAHVLERYDADRNAARLFECYRLVAGGTHVTREWWT
jgi:teichuronic acid biosynthesis glycosyltransferase TuaC